MVKDNSKLFILVLLGMLTASPFVTDMYLPSLPSMGEYFSTSSSMVQLGLTTSMIGLAVGQIFFGPLSDRYGRRIPVAGCYVVVYCVNDFLFVCAEYSAIRRFPVDTRYCRGRGIVIARSIATDKFSGKDLAKMLAIIGAINGIAPVVAPIIGGVFTEAIGWQEFS